MFHSDPYLEKFHFKFLSVFLPPVSLKACGKLARNIEALIEKTQTWASGDDSMPAALDMQGVQTGGQQALTPAATPAAAVVQQASPREGILTEPESQRKRLYVLPEVRAVDLNFYLSFI